MARRQKIPTPLLQRWRQFRYQVVPVVSFAVATILVVMIWRQQTSASHVVGAVMTRQVLVNAGADGHLVNLPLEVNGEVREGDVIAVMDDVLLQGERAVLVAQLNKVEADLTALKDEIVQEKQQLDFERHDRRWNELVENFRGSENAKRLLADVGRMRTAILDSEKDGRAIAQEIRGLAKQVMELNVKIKEDAARKNVLQQQIAALQQPMQQPKSYVDRSALPELERELAAAIARHDANDAARQVAIGQRSELDTELSQVNTNVAKQNALLTRLVADIDEAGLRERLTKQLSELPYVKPGADPVGIVDPKLQARAAPLNAEKKTFQAMIDKIDSQIKTLTIKAPFSGKVAMIHVAPGQSVTAGDPIVTIAASQSEFIVTYVRQNQRFHPHPNDDVEIRTRTSPILVRTAKIQDIGAQVEMVPAHQLRDPKSQEWGTPVRIAVPQDLAAMLRPGELVDIRFPPKPAEALPANTLAPGTLVGSVLAPAGK